MMNIIMSATLVPTMLIVFAVCYIIPLKTEKTLFGVTAKKDLRESDAAKKALKDFKKEMWLILGISLVLVPPVFFFKGDGIPFSYWMIWFFIACFLYNVPFAIQNSKIKTFKRELYKDNEENKITYFELKTVRKLKIYHFIPQIVLTALFCLPLFIGKIWEADDSYYTVYLANYLSFAVTLLIIVVFAFFMDRMKVTVISTDSTLNQNYARAKKNVWKNVYIVLSWEIVATIVGLFVLVTLLKENGFYVVYTVIVSLVMVLTAIIAFFKINKIDKAYHNSVDYSLMADDDNNWIFGMFYFNPKDSNSIVESRYGFGSTINMATKAGIASIIITILTLLTLPIISIYLIVMEHTPLHMTVSDEKVVMYQMNEQYSLDLDSVTKVTILDDCPEASKVRGTGVEKFWSGTWRTKEYGKVEMFLNPQNDVFLMIEADDETYIVSGHDDEETMNVYDKMTDK